MKNVWFIHDYEHWVLRNSRRMKRTVQILGILILTGVTTSGYAEDGRPDVLAFGLNTGNQQQLAVRGTVRDNLGMPLPGVTIIVKGTSQFTITDVDGTYSFSNLQENGTLVFSFVGMKTQEVEIAGRTIVDVTLQEDAIGLEEIVVIGYGTQKKANLTGSVSSITPKDLETRPIASTSVALQGVTPGVTVTSRTGAPGSTGTIRIRGIGTLNDSDPLVLIDGVEGDLNVIDPSMIESISVLKDAASSAIFGSRAANGVILVTTKRAQGDKLSVSYSAYIGVQTPTDLPQKVNAIDHMVMMNTAYQNSGATPLYTEAYIEEYRQNMVSDPDHYPNTDWQKEVLKGSGIMQNHNLTINAGSQKIRFLTSLGYLNQKGIITQSGYERYSLRNNADIKFSDKLNMKFDVQLISRNTLAPGTAGEVASDGLSEVFLQMNRIPAIQPGIYSNGQYGEGWNGNNPIAFSTADGGYFKNNHLSVMGSVVVSYSPVEWLTAEVMAAPKFNESYTNNFNKSITTYQADGTQLFIRPEKSQLTNEDSRSIYGNYYASVTANKEIRQHTFKLMAGTSLETFMNRNYSAYRDVFLFPEYSVLNAGSQENMQNSGSASEWALQSFFGRLNYDYKSRYLFEANARYDGSSRFAHGHKYGFFPSFSAGWRISEESFMEATRSTINNLKIRASWGRLGNQNIGTYPFASNLSLGAGVMGKQIVTIAALNDMANDLISWETSEMTNLGFDITLLESIIVTLDWYNKITSNVLLELDIPSIIGLNAPYQNAGKVRNRGWEASLIYKGSVGDFNYAVDFNISDVKNEVIDLRGVNRSGLTVDREGYPINSIFALQADGYFTSDEEILEHATQFGTVGQGDVKYLNQNDDNIINDEDKVIIGSTIPRYTYGMSLDLSYKSFTLNAFLQGVGKADGYLYGRAIQPFFSGASAYEIHKDNWTSDNQDSAFPRLTWGDTGNNYQHSSFWMKDASYLRLKNLQIGYNLPAKSLNRIGLEAVRFYVNGQNIFTLDKFWDGYDVETPVGTGTNYPQVKIYSMGVEVKF